MLDCLKGGKIEMFEKIVFGFVGLILCAILTYFAAIATVQCCSQKTREEAKKTVDDCIQKFLTLFSATPANPPSFPVWIGANGVAVRDEIVHEKFQGFYTIWQDWFFVRAHVAPSGNCVIYNFRVYNPTNEKLGKIRRMQRARQVAEKALISHFHDSGIYDVDADNFIAVNQRADTLAVVIACNPSGFQEIANLRTSVH